MPISSQPLGKGRLKEGDRERQIEREREREKERDGEGNRDRERKTEIEGERERGRGLVKKYGTRGERVRSMKSFTSTYEW